MIEKIKQFFEDVQTEISQKVTWPNREELVGSTGVVLVISMILAVFIYGVDQGLLRVLKLFLPI